MSVLRYRNTQSFNHNTIGIHLSSRDSSACSTNSSFQTSAMRLRHILSSEEEEGQEVAGTRLPNPNCRDQPLLQSTEKMSSALLPLQQD